MYAHMNLLYTCKHIHKYIKTTGLFLSTRQRGNGCRTATIFYMRLASMLSDNTDVSYSKIIGWIRCCLTLALLRSCINYVY